jgi:UDP-GlcNAc3NAcA epimerase
MIKVVTIVGARPQFIKASAVSAAFAAAGNVTEQIVHTGQHYDPGMSDVFFDELGIPAPAFHLGVGSGSHGAQTADMLKAIEAVLISEKPDAVLVYGDTNSTLAGALAAVKLHIPIAHVEAGLRSFNTKMPEEINRVLTDRVSALLFCPTLSAVEHLRNEGIVAGVHHVGDVMFDVALRTAAKADKTSRFRDAGLPEKGFVLATLHRAENTDDPKRLGATLEALAGIAREMPVVFPVHPRTRKAMAAAGLAPTGHLRVVDPVGFVDMVWLERHARLIVTDSGGVQKEAYFHGTPCVTVRTETEWTETVAAGWNRLADPSDAAAIRQAIDAMLDPGASRSNIVEYGTGAAASRIVTALAEHLGERSP